MDKFYCRAVPGARAWEDGKVYVKTAEEIQAKAKEILYGEGRGRNKEVSEWILVGRSKNGVNYNELYVGNLVDDELVTNKYYFIYEKVTQLVRKVTGKETVITNFHIFEDNRGQSKIRINAVIPTERRVLTATVGILGDEKGIFVGDMASLARQLGGNIPAGIDVYLSGALTGLLELSQEYGLDVSEISVYGLNGLAQDDYRSYVGFGLCHYSNYEDIEREVPGSYRMGVFVEYF